MKTRLKTPHYYDSFEKSRILKLVSSHHETEMKARFDIPSKNAHDIIKFHYKESFFLSSHHNHHQQLQPHVQQKIDYAKLTK